MRILISGASGFLGTQASLFFQAKGYTVLTLVRRAPKRAHEIQWDPMQGDLSPQVLDGIDVVLNFSGAQLSSPFWTTRKKQLFLDSRLLPTKTLAHAILLAKRPPQLFLSMSGTGYYNGLQEADENSPKGWGFLSDLTADWEKEAENAQSACRVITLRSGAVLDHAGGILKTLSSLARWLHIGTVGNQSAPFLWIALSDFLHAIEHSIECTTLQGPVNVVSPFKTTQNDFYTALSTQLNIKFLWSLPSCCQTEQMQELISHAAFTRPLKLLITRFNFECNSIDDFLVKNLTFFK